MLYKGVLITNASGRVDDAVASRNRGGPYFRAMGNPNPNPPSTAQLANRAASEAVYEAWAALSEDTRRRWYEFSGDTKRTGRAGHRRSVGGYQEYSRANLIRAYVNAAALGSLDLVELPPANALPPPDSLVSVEWRSAMKFRVHLDPARSWAGNAQAAMVVAVASPKPLTRYSVRAGFCVMGVALGTADEQDVETPQDYSGAAAFLRVRVTLPDGRLSVPRIVRVTEP
jgi:hypothetical protein